MEISPNDWSALLSLAFVMGLKHGLDADHLATIDGLTRYNAPTKPRLARWCGLLFSLGHGGVVIAVSVLVGALSTRWQVPAWAEDLGAWISIGFLTLLGIVNLHTVLSTPSHLHVQTVGIKSQFFGRLQRSANPFLIALVGALFALSFDTMSQASLFALTATQLGGWTHALGLGSLFTLGMLLADSANGLWISRLFARADQAALLASRVMGLTVASLSLLAASFGTAKYLFPAVSSWSAGKELMLGIGVILIVALVFVATLWRTRLPSTVAPQCGRN
jgi:high-affinity nickel-transport protein